MSAAEQANFRLSEPESGIAVLTFDTPGRGANILSRAVLDELSSHLDALEQRKDLSGLIINSGKPGIFIAGADLNEFVASLDAPKAKVVEMSRLGQTLFARLSRCPFVTVAAIDGICVGGGAEFACWCDRRILSSGDRTEFGFPEVKLGLFPGWGGTVRASRIVGLGNAVEMITGGESIDSAAALAMGIASLMVPPEQLLSAAVRLIQLEQRTGAYLRDRDRWNGPISVNDTELGFLGVTASAYIQGQTRGNYPAPLAALEVILGASSVDLDAACQMEAEGMAELFGSPVNAALLNVFFLTDRNKKDAGIANRQAVPAEIGSVSVVGAGMMGAGIVAANVKRGIPAVVTDISAEAVARGVQLVLEEVSYNKSLKGPDVERAVQRAPLINGTLSDDDVAVADLVIEAVVENIDVKKQVFARLEPLLRDDAILASNTSTIPITELAQGLSRPDRFCGIHFFNPVRRMKLVEVIRGEKTSDQTVATAVAYVKHIGKSPVVVNDGPGFLVNRLLFPYMQEALVLLSTGAQIKDIERAAKKFGMPMGPIELYDMVGLDTAMYAGATMAAAFPDRVLTSPILADMVAAGRLGRKSGAGFYSYMNRKQRAEPDPTLADVLGKHQLDRQSFTPDALSARLFMPMLLEATRVLEAGIVRDARDVDLGLILGIGFPPFRGGLMFWADTIGPERLLEQIKPLEPLGGRFQPSNLLQSMAREGSNFY